MTRRGHSDLYRSRQNTYVFKKNLIDKTFANSIIETTRTELASSIGLATKKNGPLQFHVNHFKNWNSKELGS